MAKDVKCSVETCKYNCDGCCEASCIQVDNCHCHKAKDTTETACDTFELKGNLKSSVVDSKKF